MYVIQSIVLTFLPVTLFSGGNMYTSGPQGGHRLPADQVSPAPRRAVVPAGAVVVGSQDREKISGRVLPGGDPAGAAGSAAGRGGRRGWSHAWTGG